jgi:hypothetical protein
MLMEIAIPHREYPSGVNVTMKVLAPPLEPLLRDTLQLILS